jgi:hypothetical protein
VQFTPRGPGTLGLLGPGIFINADVCLFECACACVCACARVSVGGRNIPRAQRKKYSRNIGNHYQVFEIIVVIMNQACTHAR